MKRTFLPLLIACLAGLTWAQSGTIDDKAKVEAERARLAQERKALEGRFAQEKVACYQKFAVQDCLEDSRRRRRAESENINRQEAAINDAERKRRGAAQLERLEEKKATQRPQDGAVQREPSQSSQESREQRAADHAASQARLAAEAAQRKREFEEKQRAHDEHQAQSARRRAEASANRERYEEKLRKAEEHREERERRNAERTKPRSAPLPTPP